MRSSPLNADGTTFALSYMLSRPDCPISKGIKNNLLALKAIRDEVEHKMLGRSDVKWLPLFQACCLNFDKTLVNWFGSRVTLQSELSVTLQLGRLELGSGSMSAKGYLPGRGHRVRRPAMGARTVLYVRVSTPDQKPDLECDGLRGYAARRARGGAGLL